MKNLFTLLLLTISQLGIAQSDTLAANQVWAQVNANGTFFTSPVANIAGYEVPNIGGIGPKLIYTSAFWIGAQDQNGGSRVCATGFYSDNKDAKTGPVATTYTNQNFIDRYDRVYSITKAEIQTHQQNWNSVNYTMPDDILDWPGNGDLTNAEAAILAPFVDYNGNDLYEPSLGDHPVIRGDHAQYFILNDNDGSHELTGGANLDLEYHFMVYQYATAGFLDSTTFINLKIINRSQETYNQLIVANYTDFDIGGPQDDYVGCSSDKNMMFGYNGDLVDDAAGGATPLFGSNPPACGIKLLNHNMNVAGYYNNAGGLLGDPNTESAYWNNMNGNWQDGTSFTIGGNGYGGTVPTNFIFDGNPNDTTMWTEVSEMNNPNDRRAFLASEPIDNFMPGDYICYDFAVLYSRTGGNNLLNVNGLFDVADSAQLFYDSELYYYCEPLLLGEQEHIASKETPALYPNPSQSHFTVQMLGEFDIEIYDIAGKLIKTQNYLNQNQSITSPVQPGIYLVKITQNGQSQTLKLMVE